MEPNREPNKGKDNEGGLPRKRGPYNSWFCHPQVTDQKLKHDGTYTCIPSTGTKRGPYNAGFKHIGTVSKMPKTTSWRSMQSVDINEQNDTNDKSSDSISEAEPSHATSCATGTATGHAATSSMSSNHHADHGRDDTMSIGDMVDADSDILDTSDDNIDFVIDQHDTHDNDTFEYTDSPIQVPDQRQDQEHQTTISDFQGADEELGYGSDTDKADGAVNSDVYDDDQPIYMGARINVGVHMLLIMTFVIRHGLSSAAIVDLLALIDLHCLANNFCRTSLSLFNKYFDNLKTPIERHYYCINKDCSTYFGKTRSPKHCPSCRKEQVTPAYFYVSPLAGALQTVFDRRDILSHLAYPRNRIKKNEKNIEDVYDGKLYQERFDKNGFFKGTCQQNKQNEIHLSMQLNTDGVALFKASKYSVWPVFLVINELHPKLRYSRQYRLLAGMWFGQNKPKFETFMQPMAEMISDLYTKGVDITLPDGKLKTVKALILNAVFDSPARCMFQNFTQYNGKYGCPFCLSPGESVKTSESGTTHTYQYDVSQPETGHGPERTHQETLQQAKEADTRSKGNVFGVKGSSPFLLVPQFDMIRSVAPDYMHGVMLGVIKMLLALWYEPVHRQAKWSIRKKIKDVDARLTSVKPPCIISRSPQAIDTHLKWWKASEYRAFLLFYSVPCLYGILPEPYFENLLLLVNAMHILLSDSISPTSLEQARRMLRTFVFQLKDLYHSRYLTWNVHSLLHYAKKVEDLGPLYLLSCFWYEDYNGDLRHLFHGTRGVEFQVLTAAAISQKLPILANRLQYGTIAFELYNHMVQSGKSCKMKITEKISQTVEIVGCFIEAPREFTSYVKNLYGELTTISMFKRILLSGRVIQCKLYTRAKKQNNCTILFAREGKLHMGNVITYVKCQRKCTNITFCDQFCNCKEVLYLAIVQELHMDTDLIFSSVQSVNKLTTKFVVPVKLGKIVVIPVSTIKMQCVFIEVGLKNAFVGIFPNTHEKD